MLENKYVYWLITGAVGLMGAIISYLAKREKEKQDKRIEANERELKALDEKFNEMKNELPFHYTLRDDFIRITANHDRKLDRIIELLTQTKGGE